MNKMPWIIGGIVLIGGYFLYKSGALSSLTSSSSNTTTNPTQVTVTSAPVDPGQLQNLAQALGALNNEVTTQPHPVSTLGVTNQSGAASTGTGTVSNSA